MTLYELAASEVIATLAGWKREWSDAKSEIRWYHPKGDSYREAPPLFGNCCETIRRAEKCMLGGEETLHFDGAIMMPSMPYYLSNLYEVTAGMLTSKLSMVGSPLFEMTEVRFHQAFCAEKEERAIALVWTALQLMNHHFLTLRWEDFARRLLEVFRRHALIEETWDGPTHFWRLKNPRPVITIDGTDWTS